MTSAVEIEHITVPPPPGYGRWTAELADEAYPYERAREVIDGVLWVPVTGASRAHQFAVSRILRQLFRACPDGWEVLPSETDVINGLGDVVQPDVVVVRSADYALDSDVQAVVVPPALVVEVASPSTRSRDRGAKLRIYSDHGVQALWLVEPVARTVTVLEQRNGALVEVLQTSDGQPWEAVIPFPVVVAWT